MGFCRRQIEKPPPQASSRLCRKTSAPGRRRSAMGEHTFGRSAEKSPRNATKQVCRGMWADCLRGHHQATRLQRAKSVPNSTTSASAHIGHRGKLRQGGRRLSEMLRPRRTPERNVRMNRCKQPSVSEWRCGDHRCSRKPDRVDATSRDRRDVHSQGAKAQRQRKRGIRLAKGLANGTDPSDFNVTKSIEAVTDFV